MQTDNKPLRFHPFRVTFNPGIAFPPRMSQAEAKTLFEKGDQASRKKIVEGHLWLSGDIAGRILHKLELPRRMGEDLASEGFVAIAEVVDKLKTCPDNLSAYLSRAIENKMIEYLDKDSLCPVPGRTRRDRAAKGEEPVEAPTISTATDLAGDNKEDNESVLSRLRRSSSPSDLMKPEDLYDYCRDQLDRDIIDLRYIGSVPRAIAEVAELIGVSRGTVEKRLKEIEVRIYRDLEKRMPTCPRAKGVRLLAPRPKKHRSPRGAATAVSAGTTE